MKEDAKRVLPRWRHVASMSCREESGNAHYNLLYPTQLYKMAMTAKLASGGRGRRLVGLV